MVRPVAPLWLARPSRFAGLERPTARVVALLAALLVLLSFTALVGAAPPPVEGPVATADDRADVLLYDTIVEQVRHGADYYVVAAQEMRRSDYPLRPFVTMRLPTLAVVQAHLPPFATTALLYALVVAVTAAWYARLRGPLPRRAPRLLAAVLLLAGVAPFVQRDLLAFHEVWAGLLIALSLALRRPGHATAAIAMGLSAMLIRETAALYAGVMLAGALLGGRRGEALGWTAALAVLAAAVAAHAAAVATVTGPFDPTSPGWAGLLGYGFFVRAMTALTALAVLPAWIAAPLVPLALIGWASWRDPLALRVLTTLAGYALLLALFARVDTYYWGMMAAPLLLVGLAFAPDGVRDLRRAAGARRRITVTRGLRGEAGR
ncbi:hypothetical protein HBH26_11855 [Sphingomonas sp. 36D10-4-7]|uniref:DUF2029 domain-containing protein n=1 Tax=Sphingomonas corticis TaxID=2722791 RepID=A0ABX1CRJ6_9SPHN|nr:hypothetical protein [Sphingomonas corticis]